MMKKIVALIAFCCLWFRSGVAQTDTAFWFAPPDLEINHAQVPIRFCVTTYDEAATVTFSQPANSDFTPVTFQIPADNFLVYDVSDMVDIMETKPINTVVSRGMNITSSAPISCYYESVGNNSEIYTLKGLNALGTDFLVPMQTQYNNNYSSSTSSIEIIATEDNTVVEITAPVALRGGIPAGTTVTVVLNRGQSYAVRAEGNSGSDHLHNTIIHSNKPIAVNTTDDSVYASGCFDLIGDQLVPTSMAGTHYMVLRNNSDYEYIFIYPLENQTTVTINGVAQPVIDFGQRIDYPLPSSTTAYFIESDKAVVVFQMTALGCELGGTMLPQVECTGSNKVTHLRPSSSQEVVTIMVNTDYISNFLLNGNPDAITAADFMPVPGHPDFSYCVKNIANYVPVGSVMTLQNDSARFHLGVLDGTPGGDCSYGFFSDYARSSYIHFEMDSIFCAGDSIVFGYSAPNVENLLLTGPNNLSLTTPPFVLTNTDSTMTGWYYMVGTESSTCFSILGDSIYIVVETPSDTVFLQRLVHDYYLWHCDTLMQTGIYTRSYSSTGGCDSVEVLNLTVIPVVIPDNVDSAGCTFLPEGTEWGIGQPIVSSVDVLTVSTPIVGDFDEDGQQEILLPDQHDRMNVFRADGTLKSRFTIAPIYAGPVGTMAMAKVKWQDSAYKSVLVFMGTDKYLYAYDANGVQLWQSSQAFSSYNGEQFPVPTVSFADFNHDGWSEVYVGGEIYDAATGTFLCGAVGNKGYAGRTWSEQVNPYQTIAADLYGDGMLEMAVGNSVYAVDIQSRVDASLNSMTNIREIPSSSMSMEDNAAIPFTDGNTAVVDINSDGRLDVLVMNVDQTNRVVYCYVWDVGTQSVICSKKIPNARKFGFPLVGDIDNDGYPEICFMVGTYQDHYTGQNDLIYALKFNASNSNGEMDVFWTAPHGDDSGCTGLTLFDFNHDGYAELVYRDISNLKIMNGSIVHHQTGMPVTQPYDLAVFPCVASTQIEYPVVVDVDMDGEAEIVVGGGNAGSWTNNGHLYIFKSAGIPWAPARKVWNQYMYNVTNVNEDLTIPQYLFNNATLFTDPEGVTRRPFNNFLQQATTIDQYGRPFYAVPDVAVEPSASSQTVGDSLVLTISYCNNGDNTLNAPYPITVFANAYGGDTVCTVMVGENLPVDSCTQGEIRLPMSALCGLPSLDSLVVAVNGNVGGIAQNGGLQPECDTTNNLLVVACHLYSDTTFLTVTACDSFEWYGVSHTESGMFMARFVSEAGCDSLEILYLTVTSSPEASVTVTADSLCAGESVTVQVSAESAVVVPPVAVGDILCTDGSTVKPAVFLASGKTAQGVVFHVDSSGRHGWAVHLHDQSTEARWSTQQYDVPGVSNFDNFWLEGVYPDYAGYANTQALWAAGNATVFPAAHLADFPNGWYLPDIGQLDILYSVIVTLNSSLQTAGGTPFPMNAPWYYWSSTEAAPGNPGYAWFLSYNGKIDYISKTNTFFDYYDYMQGATLRVRSVRNF